MEYKILRFGQEQNPVVIIDNFFPYPQALREEAIGLTFEKVGAGFPGLRAPFNPNYMGGAMALLRKILVDVFGFKNGVVLEQCSASIVTLDPDQLSERQSIPHIDGTDPRKMALLHYIDSAEKGGTGFYRHAATRFEAITPERADHYYSELDDERKMGAFTRKGYITGSTAHFEKIGAIEPRFNRMAIYRGNLLHSGDINPKNVFSEDPSKARLSINTFLQGRL